MRPGQFSINLALSNNSRHGLVYPTKPGNKNQVLPIATAFELITHAEVSENVEVVSPGIKPLASHQLFIPRYPIPMHR